MMDLTYVSVLDFKQTVSRGPFTACFCTLTPLPPAQSPLSQWLRPFPSQTFSRIIPQHCPQPCSFYTHLPAYEDGTDSVPKRRNINFRRRGITQKKVYNIQYTAKV